MIPAKKYSNFEKLMPTKEKGDVVLLAIKALVRSLGRGASHGKTSAQPRTSGFKQEERTNAGLVVCFGDTGHLQRIGAGLIAKHSLQ